MADQSIRDARTLLHANLHEVFGERDPEARRAAIERTYSADVRFIDPEGESVGQEALSARAQELSDRTQGATLEEDGPPYVSADTAALAWRLGPPDHPLARGIDILTIRDGRVTVLRTLLA